jgi:UDP-sulfoquinovose synthase
MKVLILGVDGYLGWSLAQHLVSLGHEVGGIDNGIRRVLVNSVGSESATPILPIDKRMKAFETKYATPLWFRWGHMRVYGSLLETLEEFEPEGIVDLAEIPSAPWSMANRANAIDCFNNNVVGTLNLIFAMKEACPEANLVKLGTLGEYGSPNFDIAEGYFEIGYHGRKGTAQFPKDGPSFYHLTKITDTQNIIFACKTWGLRGINIAQGPVFGLRIADEPLPEPLLTRFDTDAVFGTCINRFMAQAVIGEPLTPYGTTNQQRAWLPLRESMECLTLALENPPQPGVFDVFNQFNQVIGVYTLAEMVQEAGREIGLDPQIKRLENPRGEKPQAWYNPLNDKLRRLGYQPTGIEGLKRVMRETMTDLIPFKDRIKREALIPDIWWTSGQGRKAEFLDS